MGHGNRYYPYKPKKKKSTRKSSSKKNKKNTHGEGMQAAVKHCHSGGRVKESTEVEWSARGTCKYRRKGCKQHRRLGRRMDGGERRRCSTAAWGLRSSRFSSAGARRRESWHAARSWAGKGERAERPPRPTRHSAQLAAIVASVLIRVVVRERERGEGRGSDK